MHEALSIFIVDRADYGVFVVDRAMTVVIWNRFMAACSGQPSSEVVGRNLFECFPELQGDWLEQTINEVIRNGTHAFSSWEQRPYLFRCHHDSPITGGPDWMRQNCTFLPIREDHDDVRLVCVTLSDQTETAIYRDRLQNVIGELESEKVEHQQLIHELEEAHTQLLQSEKLASIGQLAAGVAHEINNPIGFVSSNVGSLDKYVGNLLRLLAAYEDTEKSLEDPQLLASLVALRQEIDLAYLKDDIGDLIRECKDGLDRVKRIVQDLKDFSRLGEQDWVWSDLHHCLDSTLNVVWNELKYKAEIVKNYGDLPLVECVPSQLNQVFMNLLVNAVQAITERGRIAISTGTDGDTVWMSVADTGVGIAPEVLGRIFDPFFTTKPVGKGTGLGLSVSYSIVAKHGGRIEVDSRVGEGSTFRVILPVQRRGARDAAQAG